MEQQQQPHPSPRQQQQRDDWVYTREAPPGATVDDPLAQITVEVGAGWMGPRWGHRERRRHSAGCRADDASALAARANSAAAALPPPPTPHTQIHNGKLITTIAGDAE